MRRFQGMSWVCAAIVLLGGTVAAADPDPDRRVKIDRKGKVQVVVVDEDGNRHEEVYEFDGDGPRPFLGVRLEKAPDGGAVVEGVIEDSAAQRAGLRKGDVVVGFNGDDIDTPLELSFRIQAAAPGDRVDLDILRDGERRTVTAELGEHEGGTGLFGHELHGEGLQEHMGRLHELFEDLKFDFDGPVLKHHGIGSSGRPKLGVQLIETTGELREHLGGSGDAGVLVGKVLPETPAEESGVRVGDLIVAADGDPVNDAGDLLRALRDKNGETIELDLIRDGRPMALDVFIPEREEETDLEGPRA